ncbi:hypothetical protein ABZ851_25745 [Streptomyces sp. NPDC047049]|uniref:hypothetical protein n=1 Tax=Streptomyces sp. NPDC047049 TaxID=3156688 RepID=UPI0033DAC873
MSINDHSTPPLRATVAGPADPRIDRRALEETSRLLPGPVILHCPEDRWRMVEVYDALRKDKTRRTRRLSGCNIVASFVDAADHPWE